MSYYRQRYIGTKVLKQNVIKDLVLYISSVNEEDRGFIAFLFFGLGLKRKNFVFVFLKKVACENMQNLHKKFRDMQIGLGQSKDVKQTLLTPRYTVYIFQYNKIFSIA